MLYTVNDKPQISVIVPIYNVDNYLYRCLASIACQTFRDFEVIMIDDGSTDKSLLIAQDFASSFYKFHLVKNKTKGVSHARNTGIKQARGEYIAFVDSDDYIDPNYLKRLYYAAKEHNADVSCCNYALYNQQRGTHHTIMLRKPMEGVHTTKKIVKLTIADFRSRSYLWNKLWHRSLFFKGQEGEILFPEMYFEDIATTARLLYYANRVVVIDHCLYYYTKRQNSIVSGLNFENLNDYVLSLGVLRNFFEKNGNYKEYRVSHWRLAFAMFFANGANILKTHIELKNFSGLFTNIACATKSVAHFISGKYIPCKEVLPQLPHKMCAPAARK